MAILAQLVDGVVAHKFQITSAGLRIGRLSENDVIVDDSSVSSRHALIEYVPNPDFPEIVEYYLSDLGSTNGTELNGQAVNGKVKLNGDDEIKIAWNSFKFISDEAPDLAKTLHILK